MKMKRILVLHLDYQLKTLSVMIFSSLPKKKGLLEQKHKLKENINKSGYETGPANPNVICTNDKDQPAL